MHVSAYKGVTLYIYYNIIYIYPPAYLEVFFSWYLQQKTLILLSRFLCDLHNMSSKQCFEGMRFVKVYIVFIANMLHPLQPKKVLSFISWWLPLS